MEKFNTLLYISYNSSFLNCKESEQKKESKLNYYNLKMIDPRDKESNTSRCHYYSFIYSFLILLLK